MVSLELARDWQGAIDVLPQRERTLDFRHFHGGTGRGSAHNPFLASRASASKRSSTVSPGAYFRYHQHTIAGVRDTAYLHGLLPTRVEAREGVPGNGPLR